MIGLVLAGYAAQGEPVQAGYSADGLYNLANAYARTGKPGMAILNYERAALLAPNDADIETNLRAVRISMGLPSQPRSWFERAATVASPSLVAWCAVIGLLAVGSGTLAARLDPRLRSVYRIAVAIGIALLGLTVANGIVEWPRLHVAVVLVADTPVRATPAPMGDTLFSLPEGQTVRILGEHEDFMFVQIKTTARGWVSRASLATVVP
jgi:tetratricopeptide (TPR) repeat protein